MLKGGIGSAGDACPVADVPRTTLIVDECMVLLAEDIFIVPAHHIPGYIDIEQIIAGVKPIIIASQGVIEHIDISGRASTEVNRVSGAIGHGVIDYPDIP